MVACLAIAAACRDNPYEPVDGARPRDIQVAANVTVPPSLPSRCGFQLTGVAFDGTYYYVAEGQFGGTDLIVLSADDFAAMARGKPELALLFTKIVATA
jgi:hypothetical protein